MRHSNYLLKPVTIGAYPAYTIKQARDRHEELRTAYAQTWAKRLISHTRGSRQRLPRTDNCHTFPALSSTREGAVGDQPVDGRAAEAGRLGHCR